MCFSEDTTSHLAPATGRHTAHTASSLTEARHSPLGEKRTAFTVFMWPVRVNMYCTSGAAPGGSCRRHSLTSLSPPAVANKGRVGWKSIDKRGSFLEPTLACHVICKVLLITGMFSEREVQKTGREGIQRNGKGKGCPALFE